LTFITLYTKGLFQRRSDMARSYPKDPQFLSSGKLIKRLTNSLADMKEWSMQESMDYISEETNKSSDMIYRWQQGRSQPKPEIIEKLAEIAYREANLPREWGKEFLLATHYPDVMGLLNTLWGHKETRTIPNRLGRMEHTRLIGRQEESKQLQKFLSPNYAAYLITVDGIGGVGKTALVLDVTHQCWQASVGEIITPNIPIFDAIIFVTAKQQTLTPQGILQQTQTNRTLHQIFQEVTKTLERQDIITSQSQDQADLVREILGRQKTLLIIDNLETMDDKQEIISFLYQLPPTVKVVVTTRERTMFAPIRLEQLAEEAALELIEQHAEEKQVMLKKGEAQMLYERIGGIPAALVYAVGQRSAGYTLETVLRNVPDADGDVARFCFQGSVIPLRGTPPHAMLMALALFPHSPSRLAVGYVSGLESDPIVAEEALSQLQRLSLVRESRDHFRMLPLTREYALAELKKHTDFDQEARERWIDWSLRFTEQYGGHDMQEWHLSFDRLESEWENLLSVFDWCATNEQYDTLKRFWCADEPNSVVDFTTIYGFWDDRLSWLSWLIEKGEARGDWLTVLDATASYGYTLAMMGRLDEAEESFKRGHLLRQKIDPRVYTRFLLNHGYLCIYQGLYNEADQLFDQATELLPHISEPIRTRLEINISYDRSANAYRKGDNAAAQIGFRKAELSASTFEWQRMANYSQNYLADIAILEENYEEAELLLGPGLTLAERNNERRRAASYKRSYARLKQKQNKLYEALDWAQQAKDGYDRLGSKSELQGMNTLIQELREQLKG
jgi:tetratricopeptide (TPR) repeat protein